MTVKLGMFTMIDGRFWKISLAENIWPEFRVHAGATRA